MALQGFLQSSTHFKKFLETNTSIRFTSCSTDASDSVHHHSGSSNPFRLVFATKKRKYVVMNRAENPTGGCYTWQTKWHDIPLNHRFSETADPRKVFVEGE